ncbi:uncharacterized protein TNCV_1971291 [Trichonephila clavipes]|uniref:Uncharacterized protein n=1 Tax=Trichonephila clavipes TaxID=2585209 RepID=A0A8X6W5Y7_TRICX|nr:uncharacterized protein TNCV_1971291 [Trichonephila clavipes]
MASLGHQSLPPTNLGRVDEEMASPSGRPLQCNQHNYARWTVKYYDNLLKVVETHSDLYEEFKQSCFGIKRATKPFSRQPTALVLEQIINADAALEVSQVLYT